MRLETKTITRGVIMIGGILAPLALRAQDEGGARSIELPNPMSPHTWFIIVAVGAFLAWCISYVLQLQQEKLAGKAKPQRESLLRRKEELLAHLANLESEKEAGTISSQRYEKEFKKTRAQLSDVLGRLKPRQDSTES